MIRGPESLSRRTTKTLPSSVAASSCESPGSPRAWRSFSASSSSVATPWTKRSARPASAIVVASTAPSPSTIATWTTCDEISVRSPSAWAASMRRSILLLDPRNSPQVLCRPRHASRRDDRVLRAALVRPAALPLARGPEHGGPGELGLVLHPRAASRLPQHVARLAAARGSGDPRERDGARHPGRRVPRLVVPLALLGARERLQHRLRPPESTVPARQGARDHDDGRLARLPVRVARRRLGGRRDPDAVHRYRRQRRVRECGLDRRLARRRVHLPLVCLRRPHERRPFVA